MIKRYYQDPRLMIILAPLVLFLPAAIAGRVLFWGTVSTQFVPWWEFAWDELLQGRLPLWNPYLGMGAPLAANYQSALFYPPHWIYLAGYATAGLRGLTWLISLGVAGHLIWAGLGTSRLLKELGVDIPGQAAGGLAFALSGYLVARAGFLSINAAAAWMPWILLSCCQLQKGSSRAIWFAAGMIAMQLLAGHAQTAWYTLLLAGIWLTFLAVERSEKANRIKSLLASWIRFGAAGIIAVGIGAIQLLPTAEYLLNSQRSAEYGYELAMTYSFWPWRFLTLLAPNLFGNPGLGNYWGYGNFWEDAIYIGLLPLFAASGLVFHTLFQLISGKEAKKRPRDIQLVLFLSAVGLVSFLLALGKNTPIFPFLYRNIPTFDIFQAPTRFSLWAVMAGSLLAGIGINTLRPPGKKRVYWLRLGAAAGAAVGGSSLLAWFFLKDVNTTFFGPVGLAGILGMVSALLVLGRPEQTSPGKGLIWSWMLIIFISADLLAAGWLLNPAQDLDVYGPEKKTGDAGRILIPAGLEYDLKFRRFFLFRSYEPEVSWNDLPDSYLPNLPMLQDMALVNNFDPLVPARFQVWFEKLNQQLPDLPPALVQLSALEGVIHLDEGGNPVKEVVGPGLQHQVWLAEEIAVVPEEAILSQVFSDGFQPGDLLLPEGTAAQEKSCQGNNRGETAIIRQHPGLLEIDLALPADSWVIWSQLWYPGWRAELDSGERLPVWQANYLIQAVCVPAGKHTLKFAYRPGSFWIGAGITAASLAGGALVFWSGRFQTGAGSFRQRLVHGPHIPDKKESPHSEQQRS